MVRILAALVRSFFVYVARGALDLVFGMVGYGVGARDLGFAQIILGWSRSSWDSLGDRG